jgi:hypothetical protein
VFVLFKGMEAIRKLEKYSAPLLVGMSFLLLVRSLLGVGTNGLAHTSLKMLPGEERPFASLEICRIASLAIFSTVRLRLKSGAGWLWLLCSWPVINLLPVQCDVSVELSGLATDRLARQVNDSFPGWCFA